MKVRGGDGAFVADRFQQRKVEERIISFQDSNFKFRKCEIIFQNAKDVTIRLRGHSTSSFTLTHGSFKAMYMTGGVACDLRRIYILDGSTLYSPSGIIRLTA